MKNHRFYLIAFLIGLLLPSPSSAGETVIEKVQVTKLSGESYRFSVTLRHDDTGWDHYADEWQILGPDNQILGQRILHHPHVDEQPFTRSSSPIVIPSDIKTVTIRAKDNVHGWASETYIVTLP